MTTIDWRKGVTGDWSQATDWSSGTVPNAADAVLIQAAGSYTLTISQAAAASLTLDAASAEVLVDGHLQLGGALNVQAGTLALAAGSTFIGDAGLAVSATGDVLGNGAVDGPIADRGRILSSGGTLSLEGIVSGQGTLDALAGSVLDLVRGGNFGGDITGAGRVVVAGAMTLASGVQLSASHVVDTASITLGAGVNLTNGSSDNFTITASSGTAVILAGGAADSFANAGSLGANGAGIAEVKTAFLNTGEASVGSGTLAFLGGVANLGTIDASGGVLSILTTVAGFGTLGIGAAGTLLLQSGTGSGQIVDFLAAEGLLELDKPTEFTGTITGFSGADRIDLLGTAETLYTYAGNMLTVTDGSKTVASLTFAGSSNSFSLTGDTRGGTLIRFG